MRYITYIADIYLLETGIHPFEWDLGLTKSICFIVVSRMRNTATTADALLYKISERLRKLQSIIMGERKNRCEF